ncbi:MAG: hypothetical protein SVR08_13100, partial [Spirochaetota bacterium]|nr:hypothetical protein [Spirochaetota bacterium]
PTFNICMQMSGKIGKYGNGYLAKFEINYLTYYFVAQPGEQATSLMPQEKEEISFSGSDALHLGHLRSLLSAFMLCKDSNLWLHSLHLYS